MWAIILFSLGLSFLSCWLKHACRNNCYCKEGDAPRSTPSSRSQTDPNAISVEMESASPSASVEELTPMSKLERELYVRLFKSLGGSPLGRAAAALTFGHYQSAQLPPNELDKIWEL